MVGAVTSQRPETIWLAFDDAWDFAHSSWFKVPSRLDAAAVGPSLRFITTRRAVESFYAKFGEYFRPFILSGSGDFHHLTAVFVRQIKLRTLAAINPFSHIVDAARVAFRGDLGDSSLVVGLGAAAVLAVASLAIATRTFQRESA